MDAVVPGMPSGVSLACLSCHDGTIAVDKIINAPGSGANLEGPWYGKLKSSNHYAIAAIGQQTTASGTCLECHREDAQAGCIPDVDCLGTFDQSALTTDLSNDHPISMTYPTASQDPNFNVPPNLQNGWNDIKLFSGKVECPSCHNVHDPAITPFLRKSNAGSALCTTCHIK